MNQMTITDSPTLTPAPTQWYPHIFLVRRTSAKSDTLTTNVPEVIFQCQCRVLLWYAHISDSSLLSMMCSDLVTKRKEDLQKKLDDAYQVTVRHLGMAPLVISHGVAKAFKEVSLIPRNYVTIYSGISTFLFINRIAATAEKLHQKAWLWYKALRGNIWPSIMYSMHMLSFEVWTSYM